MLTVEFLKRFLPQLKMYSTNLGNKKERNIIAFYENGYYNIIIQKER